MVMELLQKLLALEFEFFEAGQLPEKGDEAA